MRATSRLIRALGLVGLLLPGGCAVFRPAPPGLPAGYLQRPELAALRNPATRQAAYKVVFPEMPTVWAGGTLSAHSFWKRGKLIADFKYWSANDAGAAEHALRMNTLRGPQPLFDVIVRRHEAAVVDYLSKVIFRGPIPPEGSPFAWRFGVEPWDLATIMTIGQHVAAGDFEMDAGKRTTTLRPHGEGMLSKVVLDNGSGLPAVAYWRIGGKTWKAQYLDWQFFTDERGGNVTRLMPAEIRIGRYSLSLKLKLRAYHYDQPANEKMFIVDQKFPAVPLERLKEVM